MGCIDSVAAVDESLENDRVLADVYFECIQ
jgi:hypothetical protein